MKQIASILFAFLLVWHPSTPAASGSCGGEMAMACARCCACCASTPERIPVPLAPVQSRPAATEQMTLLLPTFTTQLMLEQSARSSVPPQAEHSVSAGALPLFQRDCALLL